MFRLLSRAAAGAVVMFCVCVPAFAQSITFLPRQDYATGDDPRSAAFGDFNGDGKVDMVVANNAALGTGNPTLSVFAGNGAGGFVPLSTTPLTDPFPYYITSADFNGDGRLDLIIAHVDSSKLSILLGNGDGTFSSPRPVPTSGKPFSVTAARMDSDGIVDLVVANYQATAGGTGNVEVLLGNGDGTFHSAGTWLPAGSGAFYVAIADFNKDSIPDIAASLDGNVGILLGNGDGTMRFGPVVSGAGARGIVAGDFNGDGTPDFAVTSWAASSKAVVALGNGDGTFQTPTNVSTGASNPWGIAASDFNGDGIVDLVTANYQDSTISVLAGNGNGTFQAPIIVRTGFAPYFAGISDFNADGMSDLAVANSGSNTISIVLNNAAPAGSIWNTPTNAIAGQNSLTKVGGCDGCYDAGASTKATIASGDAYVDFRFPDPMALARGGIAHAFSVTSGFSQDFAIRVQSGSAEIRENGIYRTDTPFTSATVFRIAVQKGVVTYAKDGNVFYTSAAPVQYPFVFGAILGTANSAIDAVNLVQGAPPGGGGSGGTGGGTGGGGGSGSGGSTGGPQPATWTSMSNVSFAGKSVQKTSGCDGCFDAFIETSQTVGTNGYVEFTLDNATPLLMAGLAQTFTPGNGLSIDFGIRIQGGHAEARENGAYRSEIVAQAGSVFRISISGGVVSYSKDGFVFYTGPASAGPFNFVILFGNRGASISNATISNGP